MLSVNNPPLTLSPRSEWGYPRRRSGLNKEGASYTFTGTYSYYQILHSLC